MHSLIDDMQIKTYEKEILRVKMQLWQRIVGEINVSGLSQRDAAQVLGVNQQQVRKLMKGELDQFDVESLIGFLAKYNQRLFVVTSPIVREGKAQGTVKHKEKIHEEIHK